MTKTVLNVGLPVKTFYIQGLIAPENSTLIRYPMKKFLFNTLFAAMVAWQLSSIAATPEFIIESERKAFQDVKLGGAGNVWSAEGRWTNGVPGQGENILYRTGLGYRSNNAQSGHDTDLVVDMDRYIYVDEVSTNAPIRVSYFSFNNHWNIPTTLSSIDGKTLEIMVNSDPQYMAFGFGLLGLESQVGSTGAFLEPASSSTPTSRASEYIDTFVAELKDQGSTTAKIKLGWRDRLEDPLQWTDWFPMADRDNVCWTRITGRYFRIRIEDKSAETIWKLSALEFFGQVMGGRL